jgi:hypothetical protein
VIDVTSYEEFGAITHRRSIGGGKNFACQVTLGSREALEQMLANGIHRRDYRALSRVPGRLPRAQGAQGDRGDAPAPLARAAKVASPFIRQGHKAAAYEVIYVATPT